MANIHITQVISASGRTVIRIGATPKSAKTKVLLQQFKKEVKDFETKWKAAAKAYRAAAAAKKK